MAQASGDVGEARWPMASAVLAALVLTILLPGAIRVGPRWLLPLLEGALLVIVIAGDPVRISRRSRELRTVSIVLVSVLVLATLWSTGQLVDYLYLAYTNATAFSPTDVMPLAHWAKMTMAIQSFISIAILGLVIARAVNVFT